MYFIKKILTMEQLVDCFKTQKIKSFSSSDIGYQIKVSVPATFETSEKNEKGLMYANVKISHSGKNRNGSYISTENLIKNAKTIKHRPLLAHIHQLDNGEYDFHAHDVEFLEDGEIEYIEKQIGSFTEAHPVFYIEEDTQNTIAVAECAIPEEYTRAAEIIKRKDGTKTSCELYVDSCEYNFEKDYLELIDFYYSGVTCLGKTKEGVEIQEGMKGARLDISDFAALDNAQTEKGGTSKMAKAKFDAGDQNTEPVVTQSVNENPETPENTIKNSEENTESENGENTQQNSEEGSSEENSIVANDNSSTENSDGTNGSKCSMQISGETYELALDEKAWTIAMLVENVYGEEEDHKDRCYAWNVSVYEDYVIMRANDSKTHYRQKYAAGADDEYVLIDAREKVTVYYLNEEEERTWGAIKNGYEELVAAKAQAEKEKIFNDKKDLMNSEIYKSLVETTSFKRLEQEIDKYEFEDLKKELDILFDDFGVVSTKNFKENNIHNTKKKSVVDPTYENKEDLRYGGIFNKK